MEDLLMQDYWNIKSKLNQLEANIVSLKAVYGNSEQIPHKAMEIVFGWEELKGAEK